MFMAARCGHSVPAGSDQAPGAYLDGTVAPLRNSPEESSKNGNALHLERLWRCISVFISPCPIASLPGNVGYV
jgi:hypothetical protein